MPENSKIEQLRLVNGKLKWVCTTPEDARRFLEKKIVEWKKYAVPIWGDLSKRIKIEGVKLYGE